MTSAEFEDLILRNDLDGLVAGVRGLTEEERQPLGEVAARWFLPYQRFAHLCWDQDLRDQHPDEYRQLQQRFLHAKTPITRETLHVAFTAAAPEDEIRQSLAFHFHPLHQNFFVSPRQIEPVLDRRLPCIKRFYANAKHLASLDDSFLIPFIRGGIIDKASVPAERYLSCLVSALHAPADLAVRRRSEVILEQPEVLEELWPAFDVEQYGYLFSAEPDEYTLGQYPKFDSWADTFRQLIAAGRLDRRRLLARVRQSIARDDFSVTGQNYFIRLHDQLQPTLDECAEQAAEYFDLFAARSGTVVKFAIGVAERLEKAKRLDAEAFYAAAPSVFQQKPKGHPKQVLSLSEKLARRKPEVVPEAINLACEALVHESPEVQELAVKQLEKWQSHLHPDHAAALGERLEMVAPSVRGRVEALIAACGRPAPGGTAANQSGEPVAGDWRDEILPRAAALPDRWRQLAGVDEALTAAKEGRLPLPPAFRLEDVPLLAACEPIRPIETVDELLDAVAHAIEKVDSADELERILDGISRLADQRPADFDRRAAPLLKRLPLADCNAWSWKGSWAGLSRFGALPALVRLVASWLSGKEEPASCEARVPQINEDEVPRLNEIFARVVERQSAPLLSAPTHRHGWIAPERFVERARQWQARGAELPRHDLAAALLRLAPDGRSAALREAAGIEEDAGRAIRWALGSEEGPRADDEREAPLWLAAGRARWPEGAIAELQAFSPLGGLPFGAGETRLVWKVVAPASAGPTADSDDRIPAVQTGAVPIVAYWDPKHPEDRMTGLLTVDLADLVRPRTFCLPVGPSPAWDRQWPAFRWPLNADPYFAAGLTAVRTRVNAKPSTFEPNHPFLEPLLEPDRPWSEMACVVLGLSLVSKDADTRSAALDALIAAVEDGRADAALLGRVWCRMAEWDGLKLNRIADALAETARVSPLHTWFAADVAQRLLASLPGWPADGHHLLSRLVEWLTELQLAVSDELRAKLSAVQLIGKSVKLSKTLLGLAGASPPGPTLVRALRMAIGCRINRAERWASGA